MKKKISLSLIVILSILSVNAFAGGVTITGPSHVGFCCPGTFYATLHSTPPSSGYSASWSVGGDPGLQIIAQNTNPLAGPLYVTVQYMDSAYYTASVYFNDNQGNYDSKSFTVAPAFALSQQTPMLINTAATAVMMTQPTTKANAEGEELKSGLNGVANREAVRKYSR